MEALTAVSVACLTIYDMVKAVESGMRIEGIRLIEKRGGRSGHYQSAGVTAVALLSVAEALDQRARACGAACRRRRCRSPTPHGRVLAQDLKALRTQPPADVSAMDGYAVRADDVAAAPVRLKVIGEVAGRPAVRRHVGAGEAARIFTGGVMPDGADTVVIQEQTKRDGDSVESKSRPARAAMCAPQGLDFRAGESCCRRPSPDARATCACGRR